MKPGEWVHIAGVAQLGGLKELYINGKRYAAAQAGVVGDTFGGDLLIGDGPEGRAYDFGGRIDELAIWKHALSAAEVATLYEAGSMHTIGHLLAARPEVHSELLHAYGRHFGYHVDSRTRLPYLKDGAGSTPLVLRNGAVVGNDDADSVAASFSNAGAFGEVVDAALGNHDRLFFEMWVKVASEGTGHGMLMRLDEAANAFGQAGHIALRLKPAGVSKMLVVESVEAGGDLVAAGGPRAARIDPVHADVHTGFMHVGLQIEPGSIACTSTATSRCRRSPRTAPAAASPPPSSRRAATRGRGR